MRIRLAVCIILSVAVLSAVGPDDEESAKPLLLPEVLASAERAYPTLLATIQERAIAQGKRLGAEGAFDAKFKSGGGTNQYGFYKNRTQEAKVEQPFRTWGGEIFGGYKRGQGNFGPWEQDLLSLSRGEWSGGLRLALLRGREIDTRRADIMLAELGIELADASVDKQRLKLLEAAAKSYWQWIVAGQNLRIAEALLALAEERADQITGAVELGELASIEIVDNRRAILQRRSAVVSAERALQNAAFELSMFYRDRDGEPRVAPRERLAEFPEPAALEMAQVQRDIERALEQRPEIVSTLIEQQQTETSLRLARNNALPAVDVTVSYSKDDGTGSITKRGSELIAGLNIETPFQRRKAKGDIAVQEAKLSQLDQKLRFARDRVTVEARDAVSAIEAALQSLELTRAELDAARRLADAERERFELGESSLFVVNLRELSAADARLKVTKSLSEYHKSVAIYRAAVAGW